MTDKMEIGDLLTFKAPTRSHCRKATRVIKGFDSLRRPLVGYHGYSEFIVQHCEILGVEKKP